MLDAAENGGPIALATRRTENTLFLQAADESGDAFDRVLEEMTRAKLGHKAGIMKMTKVSAVHFLLKASRLRKKRSQLLKMLRPHRVWV